MNFDPWEIVWLLSQLTVGLLGLCLAGTAFYMVWRLFADVPACVVPL